MKPENLNQINNDSNNFNNQNNKVIKEDFLASKKKIQTQSFSIPKDTKKAGLFSWIFSFILIFISLFLIINLVILNIINTNSSNSLFIFPFNSDISLNSSSGTSSSLLQNIQVINNNTFTINSSLQKSPAYQGKTIKATYDQPILSKAIGIYELNTGKAVFEQNADTKLSFGSITKLLTVSTMESLFSTNTKFLMDPISGNISGSVAGIAVSDQINFTDAIYGIMLPSGNDVALDVANQYGYSNFIKSTNSLASAINLKNTHISNPVGFDDPNQNYSTAQDIFLMARLYLRRDINKKVASTTEYEIQGITSKYKIKNTNDLLVDPEVYGLKTGTTDAAGQCLVLYIKIQDREYVAVLIGSSNRFKEGDNIVKWLRING